MWKTWSAGGREATGWWPRKESPGRRISPSRLSWLGVPWSRVAPSRALRHTPVIRPTIPIFSIKKKNYIIESLKSCHIYYI